MKMKRRIMKRALLLSLCLVLLTCCMGISAFADMEPGSDLYAQSSTTTQKAAEEADDRTADGRDTDITVSIDNAQELSGKSSIDDAEEHGKRST